MTSQNKLGWPPVVILPLQIIFSCILPKLPTKSLIRFKCVSKSFLAEITSPGFIKLQHENVISSNSNSILLFTCEDRVCLYDLQFPQDPPSVCRYPKPEMSVLASCEGCLLLKYCSLDARCLVLLNPYTHICREIPRDTVHRDFKYDSLYGMCHILDDLEDDFKIVRFSEFRTIDTFERSVRVYSLRSNLWKSIEDKESCPESVLTRTNDTGDVVLNHRFHVIFYRPHNNGLRYDYPYMMTRVGCFDIKCEQWCNDIVLPETLLHNNSPNFPEDVAIQVSLGVFDGQLCFLCPDLNEFCWDMWVMKEYGISESWVKLVSIAHSADRSEIGYMMFRPVGYAKESPDSLFLIGKDRWRRRHFWYDRKDHGIKEEDELFTKLPDHWRYVIESYHISKGSLKSFPGGQSVEAFIAQRRIRRRMIKRFKRRTGRAVIWTFRRMVMRTFRRRTRTGRIILKRMWIWKVGPYRFKMGKK